MGRWLRGSVMAETKWIYHGRPEGKVRAELAKEGRLYVVEPNPIKDPTAQKISPWTTRCTGPHNPIGGPVRYHRTRQEAEWTAEYNNRAEVLAYYDKLDPFECAERLKQTMPPDPGAPIGPFGVSGYRRHW